MHLVGRKVQEVYETLSIPAIVSQAAHGPLASGFIPHPSDYEVAVAKLNEFFEPKRNTFYERHMFRLIKQDKNEKIAMFVMRLRTQAEKCDFGTALNDHIKDQIVEKCASTKLRRALLKLGDSANVDQILKEAKIFETIEQTSKTLNGNESEPTVGEEKVHKIDSKPPFKRNFGGKDNRDEQCTRCGYSGHRAADAKCPAKGKSCNKCGGKDHFSRRCRSQKRFREFSNKSASSDTKVKQENSEPPSKFAKTDVETVKMVDTPFKDEYLFCIESMVTEEHVNCIGNELKMKIGGVIVIVVVDSGSRFNIIDSKTWEFLKANGVVVFNQTKEVDQSFKSYGEHPLTTLGIFEAVIETKYKSISAKFYVVKDYGKVLIGYETGVPLGIIFMIEFLFL